MNKKLIAATIAIAMLGSPVFAETDPSAEIDRDWAERAKVQQKMATHMEMMQATMSKLQASDDPAVRKQLMDEHMQEMRDMMGMMNGMPVGMASGHMMGGHTRGEGMAHKDATQICKDDTSQCRQMNAMSKRHAYLEREIAMMQMMMQQMMERDVAQEKTGSH